MLVTDDLDYSSQMIQVLQQSPYFESCYPAPFFVTELPDYGTSYFEDLWRQKGKQIRYHQFRKKS
jgi:tRNA (guanine-N7-)-methyltransferase